MTDSYLDVEIRQRNTLHALTRGRAYGQSPYKHCGFRRVGLKHDLNLKGWNSQVHREVPGKFESSNVSGDNVSREIGRTSSCGDAKKSKSANPKP